uniref:Uncharacterized protein n=1 Tax=Glossina brevipalpis TaxID=37001 RepID=A0A1A9X2B9_9MUSC
MHVNWILHPKQLVDQDDDTHYIVLNSTLAYCLPLTVAHKRDGKRAKKDSVILRPLQTFLVSMVSCWTVTVTFKTGMKLVCKLNCNAYHRSIKKISYRASLLKTEFDNYTTFAITFTIIITEINQIGLLLEYPRLRVIALRDTSTGRGFNSTLTLKICPRFFVFIRDRQASTKRYEKLGSSRSQEYRKCSLSFNISCTTTDCKSSTD